MILVIGKRDFGMSVLLVIFCLWLFWGTLRWTLFMFDSTFEAKLVNVCVGVISIGTLSASLGTFGTPFPLFSIPVFDFGAVRRVMNIQSGYGVDLPSLNFCWVEE